METVCLDNYIAPVPRDKGNLLTRWSAMRAAKAEKTAYRAAFLASRENGATLAAARHTGTVFARRWIARNSYALGLAGLASSPLASF